MNKNENGNDKMLTTMAHKCTRVCACVFFFTFLLQVDQTADGKGSLKLYDLGLAAMASSTLQAVCGTPTYMAPEMIRGDGCVMRIFHIAVVNIYSSCQIHRCNISARYACVCVL